MPYDQVLDCPNIWAFFDHRQMRCFTKDQVAISGDATHGSTPRQGVAIGQAVEEAYVLCSLLGDGSGPISRRRTGAFEAYTAIRPPQAQKVIKTSRKPARSMRLRAW